MNKAKLERSENLLEDALDWEASRTYLMENSIKKAWGVAFLLLGLNLLSWLAIVFMMPLKQTVPYVIRVNKTTGAHDIVTTLQEKQIEYDETLDKYWLAMYVRTRETYDWHTLQKDYDLVGHLSDSQVGSEYARLFQGKEALDKKFSNRIRATVRILSVVPDGNGTATIRFIKDVKSTGSEEISDSKNWIATVSYHYQKSSKMKESLRLINPFGFQVLSYRVDPELAGGEQ